MEIISNLWQLTSPTVLALVLAAAAMIVVPMLGAEKKAKLLSLVTFSWLRGKSTPAVASDETIEHALDLLEALAHSKRIADAKKVLDIIEGIQKDTPAPVAPVTPEPTV